MTVPYEPIAEPIAEWLANLAEGASALADVLDVSGNIFSALAEELPVATTDLGTVFDRIEELVTEINRIFRRRDRFTGEYFYDPFEVIAEPLVEWLRSMGEGLKAVNEVLGTTRNIFNVLSQELPEAILDIEDVFDAILEMFERVTAYATELQTEAEEGAELPALSEDIVEWLTNLAEGAAAIGSALGSVQGIFSVLAGEIPEEVTPIEDWLDAMDALFEDIGAYYDLLAADVEEGEAVITVSEDVLDWLTNLAAGAAQVKAVLGDAVSIFQSMAEEVKPFSTAKLDLLLSGMRQAIFAVRDAFLDEAGAPVEIDTKRLDEIASGAQSARAVVDAMDGLAKQIKDTGIPDTARITTLVSTLSYLVDELMDFPLLPESVKDSMENLARTLEAAWEALLAVIKVGIGWEGDIANAVTKAKENIQTFVTGMADIDWGTPGADMGWDFAEGLLAAIGEGMVMVFNMLNPYEPGSFSSQLGSISWFQQGRMIGQSLIQGIQEGASSMDVSVTVHVNYAYGETNMGDVG